MDTSPPAWKSEFIKEQWELHQGLAVFTVGGCVCLGFTLMYCSNPWHVPSLSAVSLSRYNCSCLTITNIIVDLGLSEAGIPVCSCVSVDPGSEQNRSVVADLPIPLEPFWGPLCRTQSKQPAVKCGLQPASESQCPVPVFPVPLLSGPLTAHIETQMTAVIG